MAIELTPHTDEWFEALAKHNLQQAEHTRTIVDAAGFAAVCSICGDDESREMKLVDPAPAEREVATIRLCEDCHGFRAKDFHETYEPWSSPKR